MTSEVARKVELVGLLSAIKQNYMADLTQKEREIFDRSITDVRCDIVEARSLIPIATWHCRRCGNELKHQDLFCRVCGRRVDWPNGCEEERSYHVDEDGNYFDYENPHNWYERWRPVPQAEEEGLPF